MENLEQNLNIDTKKSKKKKIVLVVLICIVALAIVSASWAFLIQPEFFPTIYWKTYKSEKNGFQVKYPRDYQFGTETRTKTDWQYAPFFSETEKESFSLKKEAERTTIRFTVYDNPEKLNPREWNDWANKNNDRIIGAKEEDDYLDFFKDVAVNDMPAIRIDADLPGQISSRVHMTKDDRLFDIFYIENLKNNKNNKDVFDLFLKSLQID
ncbi:MAG: hypothetical protein COS76_02905 [Candidatus Portnoybacteria bacterium CG06_land_8_20_14_3_00_39_12]|uniref:PsbP C-terminal domain-containing protein n=2 Tax=Candidatus Portnoyibacteriota TaxID=1817913 RepID=A0A2M8KFK2_9BACT|nr:MAG: hypothetical protein AUJ33_01300 [Parcubacteria group bacterium CG1_02_40_25]PIU75042.1 MAG: hypothetical protein COS76_02905 [Candidatus Portnoybacteria bacterium CG06_land_8_20_14_3_00_39_12]PJE58698.1 MAG: hypothetical protein COU83_02480 [Candidatus Portnoybacteria bacterium CG10_big_fil_rev_8_21_14_0_10_40_22]